MKLTPWFDGKVKPVRKGWYEAKDSEGRLDYWNGKKWCYGSNGKFFAFPKGTQDVVPWRGILK